MPIKIHSLRTRQLKLKLIRPIRMSFGEIAEQNLLLVETTDEDGVSGVGEACVMGGPYYNCETIEGTRAVVERYAAPYVIKQEFEALADYSSTLHQLFRGNGAARTAMEMSFLDLIGKKTGKRAVDLLGGARRSSIPVAWTLPSDNLKDAIEDGERAIEERGHKLFKLKVGINGYEQEVAYANQLIRHFEGRVRLIVDANQAWDERDATNILRRFHEAGVAAVEQPIAGHDPQAMSRLVRDTSIPILADESLTSPSIANLMAKTRAASGFVLKPQRDGGLLDALATARSAVEAGLTCYGGTMLESSIGSAALVALYAAAPDLSWGSELFGPLRLDGDIATKSLIPHNGNLEIPEAPGLGVVLDEDRVRWIEASHGD